MHPILTDYKLLTNVALLVSVSRASLTIFLQIVQTSSVSSGYLWFTQFVWMQCLTALHPAALLKHQKLFLLFLKFNYYLHIHTFLYVNKQLKLLPYVLYYQYICSWRGRILKIHSRDYLLLLFIIKNYKLI